jgi:hypothetical protein
MRQLGGGRVNRTPPSAVRRQLRQEIGFGCPVDGCESPYLSWHHFDPPWSEQQHHDPAGMVALCQEHHSQADAGAFTADQLRALKAAGREREDQVHGRFNWMRQQVLAVVGGNFYLETPIILQIQGQPVVWWNRDEDGFMLLNLQMLTASGQPRARIEDNDWITTGAEADIECPPSGRRLRIDYSNGDQLCVEFATIDSEENLESCYADLFPELPPLPGFERPPIPDLSRIPGEVVFPITVAEVTMNIADTTLRLGPKQTEIGMGQMIGNWSIRNRVGISIS